jgi:hypothetical protein
MKLFSGMKDPILLLSNIQHGIEVIAYQQNSLGRMAIDLRSDRNLAEVP